MPIYRLRGLGGKGVVTDSPPYDLPPDTWSDANNVRFQSNRVQKIGGCTISMKKNMPDHTPLALTQRPTSTAIIYGTATGLWKVEGLNHTNISAVVNGAPVTYTASPDTNWDYTTLSNSVIFSNLLDNPQGISPSQAVFSTIPGWGAPNKATPTVLKNWKTPRVRSYKNYLLALGMVESGIEYPQRVRWSDVSYVNSMPPNWFEDSATNDGGYNDLSDSMSHIVDGKPLRDTFIIYTSQETFAMDYVGGTMVFNFRKLFSDSGVLSPNCAVEFEGQHFVVSESDIFVHNGSSRKPVASSRVKDRLMKEISSVNHKATKVYSYPTRKEIWIAYVGQGATFTKDTAQDNYACNRAAVWSWEYDTWSFTDLPNVYDIGLGVAPDTDPRTWDVYEGTEGVDPVPTNPDTWDGITHSEELWETFSKTFNGQQMFGASADKVFYTLDVGYYFYKNDPVTRLESRRPVVCEVSRFALDFDEAEENISYHKFWRCLYPQITGFGTIRFYIGGSNNPHQPPSWDDSHEFKIGEDYKVDCFSNWRYPAIKLQDSSEGEWGFTGLDIEYFKEGNR